MSSRACHESAPERFYIHDAPSFRHISLCFTETCILLCICCIHCVELRTSREVDFSQRFFRIWRRCGPGSKPWPQCRHSLKRILKQRKKPANENQLASALVPYPAQFGQALITHCLTALFQPLMVLFQRQQPDITEFHVVAVPEKTDMTALIQKARMFHAG